ncbi:MAG: hypothetical protein PVS3B1_36510 [Ktedonobacteraceae bacterium]
MHQGDLSYLLTLLQSIDLWLDEKELLSTGERIQEISETWKLAFATWERVTHDAAQYLGNMNQVAQNTLDLSTYITFKQAVVTYIQNFAGTLAQYSKTLRKLFLDWFANGKIMALQNVLASAARLGPMSAEEHAARSEDIQRQIKALQDWFVQERNAQLFSTIIDGCLGTPASEYTLADGTEVALLNPEEEDFVALHADDGTLFLPRYRLLNRSMLEKNWRKLITYERWRKRYSGRKQSRSFVE